MDAPGSRFAHLLQPIKQLTKNWEVDIASELNDYLEELDQMCITFDEGELGLNFSEAALLIQGSACIYSKKVELLHSLVYNTLGYINDKKQKKSKQAAESEENHAEEEIQNQEEDYATFTDIDIDPSNLNDNWDPSRAVNDVPLPPECLIPQDSRGKHKLPLISLKGEILYSQKDFRLITLIPENGTILLTLASDESRGLMEDYQPTAADCIVNQPQLSEDSPVCPNATRAEENVNAVEDDFFPLNDDGGMDMEHGPEEHRERLQAPPESRLIRERRHVEASKPKEVVPPAEVNVWQLHDPYAALVEQKPFTPGKCYKVPEGLDGGKRKRKRASVMQDFETWFRGSFDPPTHKLKNGPAFMDLNYIYLTTVKDKFKNKKGIYKKAGITMSDEELRQTFLQPEDQRQDAADEVNPAGILDDNDDFDNDHDEFPDDIPAEFMSGPDFISPENLKDDLSYEQLVKLRVEQLVVNSRGYTQETALSRKVKEWEDKIKPELALQEERLVFNIHDYSDRIINTFENVGQHKSFFSIVSGLDNFEVCKYLLSSLQLANDYTVEIDSVAGLEESVDSMGLTLLSVHRATERFKTNFS
ncbi:unnamed protein product [Knipowitschia caucasica]|uniref:Condensin-2 complex subunit H2 n=1 Tax=Knipowitschia caucasica TaxID=637954 RepID=A0AAV2ISR8_KNICA